MINLIPNEEKKKMTRGFYFRFLAVIFIMLGAFFLLFSVAVSPSFYLVSSRENLVNENIAAQLNEPMPETSLGTLSAAQDLEKKIGLTQTSIQNKFPVSEKVISEIVLHKMPDIKITQIFYEVTAAGEKKVTIKGNAPSRERLLLFRVALESSLAFETVDLPISNFVKGRNIEFSLNLTPA